MSGILKGYKVQKTVEGQVKTREQSLTITMLESCRAAQLLSRNVGLTSQARGKQRLFPGPSIGTVFVCICSGKQDLEHLVWHILSQDLRSLGTSAIPHKQLHGHFFQSAFK